MEMKDDCTITYVMVVAVSECLKDDSLMIYDLLELEDYCDNMKDVS
jgi:hypothetical protein